MGGHRHRRGDHRLRPGHRGNRHRKRLRDGHPPADRPDRPAGLRAVRHRPARDGDEEEALAPCVPGATLAPDRINAHQRLQEASDAERQRLERDLHDGAPQNLVALRIRLGLLEARLADGPEDVREDLDQLVEQAEVALDELRRLAHGTHREDLARLGLRGALDLVAGRAGALVRLDGVAVQRLAPAVEEALYFAAREAMQNTTTPGAGEPRNVDIRPATRWESP